MRIWDEHAEAMPREDLLQLQLERLQGTLHRVSRSVAFYRQLFDASHFDPEEFRTLGDLERLPFTTKGQIGEHYPYGMFAVPLREVVRLHTATSTTGRPTIVGSTARDIHTWSELVARVLTAAGIAKDDVVQIAFDYGLHADGFGFHYGAERVGASVIPTSAARIGRQAEILRDYRSTALISPPSVGLALAGHLAEQGIDPKSLFLRVGVFSGEPWSERLRAELEDRLLIRAADTYAVGEVLGPGVAGECGDKAGLHLQEDHYVAEVIDPATGAVLPDGEEGELVLTTITREAFPVIRYRTGDLTRLQRAPCACGRTLARMARVVSRTDDMVSIRGVHFYPGQIEELLFPLEGARPRFLLVLRREGGQDSLEIRLEVSEGLFFDEMRRQRLLLDDIQRRIQEELKITARIKLVEPRSLGVAAEGSRVRDERPR